MSCGSGSNSSDPFANCKYKEPKAVFEGAYAKIDSQKWELKKMDGIEEIWFRNGMHLELLQQGCDKLKQTFHFTLPGKFTADENWVLLAASQFEYLGSISESHFELGIWGKAIEQHNSSLSLGEKIQLQPGYSVKIDKVLGEESTLVMVELSED